MEKKSFKDKIEKNWLFRLVSYPCIVVILVLIHITMAILTVFQDAYDVVYTDKYNSPPKTRENKK